MRMAVGGLQRVMDRGAFRIPPSVVSATERFKEEADPVRGFIRERVRYEHMSTAPFVPRSDLYTAFVAWSAGNGFHQGSASRFYEQLVMALERPIKSIKLDGVYGYRGIVLT